MLPLTRLAGAGNDTGRHVKACHTAVVLAAKLQHLAQINEEMPAFSTLTLPTTANRTGTDGHGWSMRSLVW